MKDLRMDVLYSASERVDQAYRCLREAIVLARLGGASVDELEKLAQSLRFPNKMLSCHERGLLCDTSEAVSEQSNIGPVPIADAAAQLAAVRAG